jgi:hypothetical protein
MRHRKEHASTLNREQFSVPYKPQTQDVPYLANETQNPPEIQCFNPRGRL